MWSKTLLLRKFRNVIYTKDIIKNYSVIATVLEKANVGEVAEVKVLNNP